MSIEFLRPWWFLGALPVIWLLWQAWHRPTQDEAWHRVIEPRFQNLLLGRDRQQNGLNAVRLALIGLGLVWALALIALAGPSLKSVQLPAQKTQQGHVIVLDLSLSMLADDLKPNRLSRVRYKLIDLLRAHPQRAFGMVAYAGSAHTIVPVSEDNQTLLSLVPSLNPLMMPKFGSEPLLALQHAHQLLQGAHVTQGHIIWVTDDVEPKQREAIQKWLTDKPFTLSILAVGSAEGAAIPLPQSGLLKDDKGAIVMAKLPYGELQTLSRNSGAALTPLRLDDRDLPALLPTPLGQKSRNEAMPSEPQETRILHPLDDGSAVLLVLVLLLALGYRRGWLFSATLLLVLPIGAVYPPAGYAQTAWDDFGTAWMSADQQGYQAWQKGDYAAAAELFEAPLWKGSALYRNGQYAEAAAQFKRDRSAQGFYNLGNAQVAQGLLQEAKQAYEQALRLDANLKDAQANLQQVEAWLRQSSHTETAQNGEQNGEPTPQDAPQPQQNESTENTRPPSGAENHDKPRHTAETESPADTQTPPSTEPEPASANDSASAPPTDARDGEQPTEPDEAKTAPSQSADQPVEEASSDDQPAAGSLTETDSPDTAPDAPQPSERELANQNWFKQIPDQPAVFLKRKFEYQFQQNSDPSPPSTEDPAKQW